MKGDEATREVFLDAKLEDKLSYARKSEKSRLAVIAEQVSETRRSFASLVGNQNVRAMCITIATSYRILWFRSEKIGVRAHCSSWMCEFSALCCLLLPIVSLFCMWKCAYLYYPCVIFT